MSNSQLSLTASAAEIRKSCEPGMKWAAHERRGYHMALKRDISALRSFQHTQLFHDTGKRGKSSACVAFAHLLCLLPLFWKVRDVGVLSVDSSACCPRRSRRVGDGLRLISELHRLKGSLPLTTWLQCRAMSVRREGGRGCGPEPKKILVKRQTYVAMWAGDRGRERNLDLVFLGWNRCICNSKRNP